jgi:beta-galactosidase
MRPMTLSALAMAACAVLVAPHGCSQAGTAPLPDGVKAVWDMGKAYHEMTPTRERICINGLWRWQPAKEAGDTVPDGNWGYFKVPGSWPGITNYMQKDCQTVFAHPSWQDENLGGVTTAWYQREITVPADWAGRRITLEAAYVNSYAAVYVDGKKAGEVLFPGGKVDLSAVCRPGAKHDLALLVVAMPLKGVMLSDSDTASVRQVQGSVARRGLCGDVYLCSSPTGPGVGDVKVDTSVRKWEITFEAGLAGLAADGQYALRAEVTDGGRKVGEFTSKPFGAADLKDGRFTFTGKWKPDNLWDIHTPQHMYNLSLSLTDAQGKVLDTGYPTRFGFREFWIDGRDFYLNGTRLFLSSVPLDNAQVGAAWASYEGARESLLRLKSFGINFVYTHNYDCKPGSYLSFEEELRAADDVGMIVALSQPHFGDYDWKAEDADQSNGYARHAAFFVRAAGNHPSVVMYSMSHNATGYSEDMNPDLIDGVHDPRDEWSRNNVRLALRAEAIVHGLDPARIVYHHSSGNLSSMHTMNFYTNFAPIQELSDWFEHWATEGAKPVFTCEYMVPCTWDWTMYRGWYKGAREFGSATVPWDFSIAEWNSQFLGDAAFRISEAEKTNLRWEAQQFRAGNLWHRWDYPNEVGSRNFDERYPVIAAYLTDNWRAFRTWGMSANSPWEWGHYWKPREGVDRSRQELPVDWDNLQRPGFSPDYIEDRYQRVDLAFERPDWIATPAAQSLLRNNMPLLAYIAGKPEAFTSKDHSFFPGETVEKQLIVINNSREPVTADCKWSSPEPKPLRTVEVMPGEQQRLPLSFTLPADLQPGNWEFGVTIAFSTGETQKDSFVVHVMSRPAAPQAGGKIALFDPKGKTAKLLAEMGVQCQPVEANADLSGYDMLVIGKRALTVDGPAPDIARVRDGLKVITFEQTPDALEKRLGFRVAEYGLRQVFERVPDHPLLAGLDAEALRDWRGEATLLPPRLSYDPSMRFNGAPTVKWCGIDVSRVWRCGNRGTVASALIEKPPCGDFLPILDGGYSLQYSPLLEYREGKGMVLFCQVDVTGRTESDPAAETLARNIVTYVSAWKPAPTRKALYVGDPAGKRHLERAGVSVSAYEGGKLSADRVLVVGSGGGKQLAANAAAIAEFVKAGGHVLALGLDEQEANAFLPLKVGMTNAEHIAAFFDPPGADSLLKGIGPADVHNRDPRELPLVSSGAVALGDGVLAKAEGANVVFDQLPPYAVTSAEGAVASFVIDDKDAVEGKQSALVTMGSTTERGVQFGQAVKVAPEVGKTYTFTAFVKGVGGPVRAHLEVERAGRPWDRAVKGQDIAVGEDEWTELHETFKVDKPFPEGWQAYIGCAQDGGQLRADMFRLYEGEYKPWAAGAAGPENLFANAGFEEGQKPWFFVFGEQYNLRKTYRRTSFTLTRLLANIGVSGETPLLARFATPFGGGEGEGKPGASVVRNGDFSLDADGDGMADEWLFSGSGRSSCAREQVDGQWCERLTLEDLGEKNNASVMLAQHDVPMVEGQWYRASIKAKAEGLHGGRVTFTVTHTEVWRSFFDYQYFAPSEEWREFHFLVQSNAGADAKTRLQIWHGNLGTVWLADVKMEPVPPPTEGRWAKGLYLDEPEEWDYPYRFFRW